MLSNLHRSALFSSLFSSTRGPGWLSLPELPRVWFSALTRGFNREVFVWLSFSARITLSESSVWTEKTEFVKRITRTCHISPIAGLLTGKLLGPVEQSWQLPLTCQHGQWPHIKYGDELNKKRDQLTRQYLVIYKYRKSQLNTNKLANQSTSHNDPSQQKFKHIKRKQYCLLIYKVFKGESAHDVLIKESAH